MSHGVSGTLLNHNRCVCALMKRGNYGAETDFPCWKSSRQRDGLLFLSGVVGGSSVNELSSRLREDAGDQSRHTGDSSGVRSHVGEVAVISNQSAFFTGSLEGFLYFWI